MNLITNFDLPQCILWLPDGKNWLIWKHPDAGKDWRREEKGTTEDEIVGWHHWLSGYAADAANLHQSCPILWDPIDSSLPGSRPWDSPGKNIGMGCHFLLQCMKLKSESEWIWVWANSGSWWWTGRPGMLQSMGLQRVRHDWATKLNWTERRFFLFLLVCFVEPYAWPSSVAQW